MGEHLEVVGYSIDALVDLIERFSPNDRELILSRSHHAYFSGYFGQFYCKTIVVEKAYVDRDYLEDYSGYYVRCFQRYRRTCARLHFFTVEFGEEEIIRLLDGDSGALTVEQLQESYLGFVVLKPLPATPIGRTCLRTYPHDGRRHYPITRKYEANLFGIPLRTKSIAFQEQDTVVAACATSALWSVFHCTGVRFQHAIPSPLEITRLATTTMPLESRALPNTDGLNTAAIAAAIRKVGLEPYLINVSQDDGGTLKAALYAYLNGGIPMIFCFALVVPTASGVDLIGHHAVAATGFSLGGAAPTPIGQTGFLLRSTRIDKIYVHDDGVGPFARMEFDGVAVNVPSGGPRLSLSTSWIHHGRLGLVRAIPGVLMVPVYHKIRITFAEVHDTVLAFDWFVEDLRNRVPLSYAERMEWDISLTTSSQLKTALLSQRHEHPQSDSDVLLSNMPKYLWRTVARIGDRIILDLVLDATDIQHGDYFVRTLEVEDEMQALLENAANMPAIKKQHATKPEWKIVRGFRTATP